MARRFAIVMRSLVSDEQDHPERWKNRNTLRILRFFFRLDFDHELFNMEKLWRCAQRLRVRCECIAHIVDTCDAVIRVKRSNAFATSTAVLSRAYCVIF